MTWTKRWQRRGRGEPSGPAPTVVELSAEFAGAIDAAVHGGRTVLGRLVDVLAGIDAAGDTELARSALRRLSGAPKAVLRLDEHARRDLWYSPQYTPTIAGVVSRLHDRSIGPIGLALASTHGDGRVREAAVAQMLAAPTAELTPFLMVRTTDWVKQVRDRARAGLALLLADDPASTLPAALPMGLLIEGRTRGGFARTQLTAALITAPVALREQLAASPARDQRRFVFGIGLAQRWWRVEQLAQFAESDPDAGIRARTAEAACREAVWMGRPPVLQRLARSRRAEVRVVALTGLSRAGQEEQVARHLDDPSGLVRAVARDAARRTGVDTLAHYRQAVAQTNPALSAIAGLAETGAPGDAAAVAHLLAHPQAKVRVQAIRAIRRLGAVVAEEMVALLRDPSAAVVREATRALEPLHGSIPASVLWQLLADQRAELRLAGYRLLRRQDGAGRLRAAERPWRR